MTSTPSSTSIAAALTRSESTATGQRARLVADNGNIAIGINSHRCTRFAAAITTTRNTRVVTSCAQFIHKPDYSRCFAGPAGRYIADDNYWYLRFEGSHDAVTIQESA
jgi:hypothetical protein